MHDPDMLDNIASAASGMYYRIIDPEVIPGAFTDCLGGILSVVARSIQVEITPGTGVEVVKVLTKFPIEVGALKEINAAEASMMRTPSLKGDVEERMRRNSIAEEEVDLGNHADGPEQKLEAPFPRREPFRVQFRDLQVSAHRFTPARSSIEEVELARLPQTTRAACPPPNRTRRVPSLKPHAPRAPRLVTR